VAPFSTRLQICSLAALRTLIELSRRISFFSRMLAHSQNFIHCSSRSRDELTRQLSGTVLAHAGTEAVLLFHSIFHKPFLHAPEAARVIQLLGSMATEESRRTKPSLMEYISISEGVFHIRRGEACNVPIFDDYIDTKSSHPSSLYR
jgi:hypothetical protein